jgi:predicted nucleic acid-binding protein
MSVEFVDTNILIYAHDATAGRKHDKSVELVSRLANDDSGAISLQVLTEFYAAATRKLRMASEKAEEIIGDFGTWTVHHPTKANLVQAIQLHRRYNINFWDALILNSATELECNILWTEGLSHGQHYGVVTVRNPFL